MDKIDEINTKTIQVILLNRHLKSMSNDLWSTYLTNCLMPKHKPLQRERKEKSEQWFLNIFDILRENKNGTELHIKYFEKL
jgi:hypothetical protein